MLSRAADSSKQSDRKQSTRQEGKRHGNRTESKHGRQEVRIRRGLHLDTFCSDQSPVIANTPGDERPDIGSGISVRVNCGGRVVHWEREPRPGDGSSDLPISSDVRAPPDSVIYSKGRVLFFPGRFFLHAEKWSRAPGAHFLNDVTRPFSQQRGARAASFREFSDQIELYCYRMVRGECCNR